MLFRTVLVYVKGWNCVFQYDIADPNVNLNASLIQPGLSVDHDCACQNNDFQCQKSMMVIDNNLTYLLKFSGLRDKKENGEPHVSYKLVGYPE